MPPILFGNQTPTYAWAPPSVSDASYRDAMEVCRVAGLYLDPWQDTILRGGLGETADMKWSAFEVANIVGRQNGKGTIIEARELAGLFAYGEKLITHSAHEFKTSGEAFRRMLVYIESVPEFDQQVLRISRSKGEEGIELRGNRRLRYMARTGGAGRGFSGDCIVLDEAMILDDSPIAALIPTLATRENPQIWYFGSAGDRRLPTQSVVLARVRRRGLAKDPVVALFMWEAHRRHVKGKCPEGCELDPREDPATWAKTMPAMGIRVTPKFLRNMMGTMAGWDFDREFLGAGDYPADEGWTIVSKDTWLGLRDPESHRAGPYAIGMEAREGGSEASVAIAGFRGDGQVHVEVVKHEVGTGWMGEFTTAMITKSGRPCATVVNPRGPAAGVLSDLTSSRLRLHKATQGEYASWCAKWMSMVTETRDLRHLGQLSLNNSVMNGRKKMLGQGLWVWEHANLPGDASGLHAVTLALGGLLTRGVKRRGSLGVASVTHGRGQRGVTRPGSSGGAD